MSRARQWRRQVPAVQSWRGWLFGCLGGLAFLTLTCQVLTGLSLSLFLEPGARQTHALAWLIHRLHAAGGGLLLAFTLGHLVRVAWMGAFRPPGDMAWLSGCGLLVLALGAAVTGACLPGAAPARELTAILGLDGLSRAVLLFLHLLMVAGLAPMLWAHVAMIRRHGVRGPL